MQKYVMRAGAIPASTGQQSSGNNNLIDFLRGRGGDIEREIVKKGMSKAQAQQAAGTTYMNNEQLIQARQKEKDKMNARRKEERDGNQSTYQSAVRSTGLGG